jgi:hypothetical protein
MKLKKKFTYCNTTKKNMKNFYSNEKINLFLEWKIKKKNLKKLKKNKKTFLDENIEKKWWKVDANKSSKVYL